MTGHGGARAGAGRNRLPGLRTLSLRLDEESALTLGGYAEEHGIALAAAVRELATAYGQDERVRRAVAAWRERRG